MKASPTAGALALGAVVIAAALCLPLPFWGDQALFTVYGRQLTEGAVLYRDVFDVKQPGIFVFYAFGGKLFGFTELGIHLFELAYWLSFSLIALRMLRPHMTRSWAAPLVPVFTVAVYYLSAGLLDLTQVEMLVAFPLLVAWWLIDQADPGTTRAVRRYAAAGLAAASVVLLKHLYILIVMAFVGYAVLRARRRGIPMARIGRSVGAFGTALLVPLLLVAGYFAAHGQLGRIWWAYFEMAPRAQLGGPRPLDYLVVGARRFMIGHAPILILAILGLVRGLRDRVRPQFDLIMGMVLWCVVGGIAFFIQGWPEYKWSLFTVPVGILAVVGIEALAAVGTELRRASRGLALGVATGFAFISFLIGSPVPEIQTRLVLSVAIGILAAVALEGLAFRAPRRLMLYGLVGALGVSVGLTAIVPVDKARSLIEHDLAWTVESRAELRRSLNHSYRAADEDLELLRSRGGDSGPIYVFGDPVLLLRANRRQPVPILGWGPEFFDARAWQELHAELRTTLPRYIVVDEYIESIVRARFPPIIDFIQSRYRVAFVGASGTWYALS